jgi:hypothetical protein
MSPETAKLGKALPTLNVAAEGLFDERKEAFLRKLRTANSILGFSRLGKSFLLTTGE